MIWHFCLFRQLLTGACFPLGRISTWPKKKGFTYPKISYWTLLSLQSDWLRRADRNEVRSKIKIYFSISPSQLWSHKLSALNAGAKRSGATCHMAMPQCCYLAKGAKRPSHQSWHVLNRGCFEHLFFCMFFSNGLLNVWNIFLIFIGYFCASKLCRCRAVGLYLSAGVFFCFQLFKDAELFRCWNLLNFNKNIQKL